MMQAEPTRGAEASSEGASSALGGAELGTWIVRFVLPRGRARRLDRLVAGRHRSWPRPPRGSRPRRPRGWSAGDPPSRPRLDHPGPQGALPEGVALAVV
ncbi:MAG: hypothetical protein KC501_09455, partial [Myxococcales bacterium]|nr:hypothetical protein [Myxococcales bacterium]